MIVRFRRGNMAETRPVHGKLDHHVSAGRKRDGYKQLPVSVEFPKYGNTLFCPVLAKGPHERLFLNRVGSGRAESYAFPLKLPLKERKSHQPILCSKSNARPEVVEESDHRQNLFPAFHVTV